MKGKKQGVLVVDNQNPLRMLKTNYKECETHIKNWLVKTSFRDTAVEAAITTVAAAFVGGVLGYAMENLCTVVFGPDGPVTRNTKVPVIPIFIGGGPLIQARNTAVITGVHAGTRCVIERLRGKEDFQSNLVGGFCAGVVVSLVCGIKGTGAISNGVSFALLFGGNFKVRKIFS